MRKETRYSEETPGNIEKHRRFLWKNQTLDKRESGTENMSVQESPGGNVVEESRPYIQLDSPNNQVLPDDLGDDLDIDMEWLDGSSDLESAMEWLDGSSDISEEVLPSTPETTSPNVSPPCNTPPPRFGQGKNMATLRQTTRDRGDEAVSGTSSPSSATSPSMSSASSHGSSREAAGQQDGVKVTVIFEQSKQGILTEFRRDTQFC